MFEIGDWVFIKMGCQGDMDNFKGSFDEGANRDGPYQIEIIKTPEDDESIDQEAYFMVGNPTFYIFGDEMTGANGPW